MTKAEMLARVHTSNSIENKQGGNAFIYHTKQTDYII